MGERIGDYEIIAELGVGSTARVYSARGKVGVVALKVFESLKYTSNAAALRRVFEHELRTIRSLDHPHIVKVLDAGVSEDVPFIAMELMDQGSLEGRIARRDFMDLGDTLAMVEPLARALDHAHDQKVLHRDVKPSNVLFDGEGRPVLTDFGVAKWIQPMEGATVTGAVEPGTSDFMAPEVLNEAPPSRASDIYSLAMTTYFALSGELPSRGKTVFARCRDRVQGKLIPLSEQNPAVPRPLSDVVMRGLAVEPLQRFDTATKFAHALSLAESEPEPSSPTVVTGTAADSSDDSGNAFNYWRFVIVPIAVALLGALGVWLGRRGG